MAERMDWFPFHAQDFLTSRTVLLMSDENVGRYVKLLAESWVHGPLPKDMGKMGRLIRLSADEMEAAWQEIGAAFDETDAGYVNPRLEETRREQEAKRKRYVKAGKKGAKARWSQGDNGNANGKANGDAKGNSNATPNSSKKKNKKEKQIEVDELFEEEFWPRYPERAGNRGKKQALSSWRARLRDDGVDPAVILEATKRYAEFCDATDRTDTSFVMLASTFLNDPDNFDNDWTPEAPKKEEGIPHHHGGPWIQGRDG